MRTTDIVGNSDGERRATRVSCANRCLIVWHDARLLRDACPYASLADAVA